jgi:hypothetical protein
MSKNAKLSPSFKKAIKKLNSLPRKKGEGREITLADLVSLDEAQKLTGKSALYNEKLWSDKCVFIKTESVIELYKSLTDKGREALAQDEILGGWFVGDGDEENEDDDGEFCSTPCHDEEIPEVEDFEYAVNDCSAFMPADEEEGTIDGDRILFLY